MWEEIEGTIKDTDRDLYERIETAQGLIKDGAENENAERSSRAPTTRPRPSTSSSRRTADPCEPGRRPLGPWARRLARRRRPRGALTAVVGALAVLGGRASAGARRRGPRPAACSQGSLSKQEAIDQLHDVRASIDRTLRLLDAGRARGGLRRGPHAATSTASSPSRRRSTSWPASTSASRSRTSSPGCAGLIDIGAPHRRGPRPHRHPPGPHRRERAPAHRQGLRRAGARCSASPSRCCSGRASRRCCCSRCCSPTWRRASTPATGSRSSSASALAVVATVVTFFAVDALFSVLPFGREVLEAVVGLLAVAMLFYVSFWLIARLDQRRRMEFLQARVWRAASVGSATSLALVGFTAVYREGFETVLFYQALFSFGEGLRALDLPRDGRRRRRARRRGVGGPEAGPQAAGEAVPHRRAGDRDADLGRRARQRHAGAAGGGHPRPPLPRQLAATCRSSSPRPPGTSPRSPSVLAQGALLVVYVIGGIVTYRYARRRRAAGRGGRVGRAVGRADRRARRLATVSAVAMGVRIGVDVGGTFTKAVAIDVADGALLARAVVPTTHDRRRRARRRASSRWCADVAHAVGADAGRAHHLLDDPGRERPPRGRRRRRRRARAGPPARPAQGGQAHAARQGGAGPGPPAPHGARVPRHHRRAGRRRRRRRPRPARGRRAPPRSAWPRRSRPTAAATSAGPWSWPSPAGCRPAGRRR